MPESARTVRPGPERPVTEGPFAETVEQLGGFWLVDLPDLESALGAAASCCPRPTASRYGPIVDIGD